jgi:hypothetical protein
VLKGHGLGTILVIAKKQVSGKKKDIPSSKSKQHRSVEYKTCGCS